MFWGALLALLVLALWLLRAILLPFVLGMAIAFLLDPPVAWLEGRGVSRAAAAGVIVLGSYAVGLGAAILLAPVIVGQVVELSRRFPAYVSRALDLAEPVASRLLAAFSAEGHESLAGPLEAVAERVGGMLGDLVAGLLGQGWALLNLAGLLAVTPLVTFYLLRDWPRFIARIDELLPLAHAETIRARAHEIDRILAGFARGQAIVCVALGLFYAVALSVLGIDFGLVIGLGAGIVSFVPYLGTAIGLVASVGMAMAQFWPGWTRPLLALVVFFVGQLVADYVLTPRLVGERVGLHPLWVIFAVFAGGALFGVVGMLIAVPASAAIGVLVRLGVGAYKGSSLYRDGAA